MPGAYLKLPNPYKVFEIKVKEEDGEGIMEYQVEIHKSGLAIMFDTIVRDNRNTIKSVDPDRWKEFKSEFFAIVKGYPFKIFSTTVTFFINTYIWMHFGDADPKVITGCEYPTSLQGLCVTLLLPAIITMVLDF